MASTKNLQPVILLFLLSELRSISENKTGNTRIQKLLFLIQKEGKYPIENGFNFKPYKYGPYSDEFFDVVYSLSQREYLSLKQNEFGDITECRLTQKGQAKITELSDKYKEVREDVRGVVSEYGGLGVDLLLLYVYTKYSDFTIRSEIKEEVLQNAKKYFKVLQAKANEFNFSEEELQAIGA